MNKNKKGVDISINTIIVAAIALAVLVVLFVIFTGRLGIFTKGVQETDTCRQKCDSLNMKPGADVPVTITPGSNPCPGEQRYVAGSYIDGKGGCCCEPK